MKLDEKEVEMVLEFAEKLLRIDGAIITVNNKLIHYWHDGWRHIPPITKSIGIKLVIETGP